tara:strand:- start:17088 stop:18194 length:1107 start_codon:yes stop_codon:yes gene_type:complete
METLNVRASSVTPILLRALKVNRPIFIWGAPGIGKSELVEGIVQSGELGNAVTIDLRLALLEPTDLRGYPFRNPETNTMEWSPPSDLPSEEFASNYDSVVLFLDELNSAPPSVQAAAYQLVLNRRIGQYKLPKNVKIIAAGNRETDRGVTYRMPAPLANRFRHINMEVNFEDWQKWAINNDIHPDVIGYLSFSKGDLFDFDAKSSSQSFATPRSWTFVSEMLGINSFDSASAFEQKVEIAGAIGEGMAIKFVEHRKIASKLPNPDQILAGEVKTLDTKLSKEISAKYSLVVGLAYELNDIFKDNGIDDKFRKGLNNTVRFAYDNFEPEMVVFLFKTIMKDYQIRFNVRTDLDKDLHKTFSDRYTKYIA